MIIGITGPSSSGKDTIADYLKQKGFGAYSCSDIVREKCRGLGKDTTRENLIVVGTQLREKFGNDFLALEILRKIERDGTKNSVVTSIRHPSEVEALKQNPGFKMMLIDAPIEIRYERTQNRNQNRSEDNDSFEKFKENEEREKAGTGGGQQLDTVAKMTDDAIMNDGSLDELYKKVDRLLARYEKTD